MRYWLVFILIGVAFLNSCGNSESKMIHFGPGPSMDVENEEAASKEEISRGDKT